MKRFVRIVIIGQRKMDRSLDLFRNALSQQIGNGNLSIATAIPSGAFGEALGGRGITLADQMVSITWSEDDGFRSADEACSWLRRNLSDVLDISTARLAAGTVHRLRGDKSANVVITILGRRHPNISVEDFRHWWLNEHAPMAMRITEPPPVVYDQLHVDADLSRSFSEQCGIAFEHFDLVLSAQVNKLDDFLAPLSNPEIAVALIQDEIGKIDHAGGGIAAVCAFES